MMKHPAGITLFLIISFMLAQIIGLVIISEYIDIDKTSYSGKTVLNEDNYFIEPPRVKNESFSFVAILIMVLIGTAILLLLIRLRQKKLWRFWFFASVLITLSLSFFPFVRKMMLLFGINGYFLVPTLAISAVLSVFKVLRPNVAVHNLTELLIYGGMGSLLVPIINVFSAFFLLMLISAYDIYAVRRSKHMVKMAKFQYESNLFAGIMIPKKNLSRNSFFSFFSHSSSEEKAKAAIKEDKRISRNVGAERKIAKKTARRIQRDIKKNTGSVTGVAILGGGDIAFPLLFAGAVLKSTASWLSAYIIVASATLALSWLLLTSKKGRFYPAMPPLAMGCFAGYAISLLVV